MLVQEFAVGALAVMNGLRWLLPVVLVGVAVIVLCADGHVFCRWARRGEPITMRQWVTENFWILLGLGMIAYLAGHYPRRLW